jgi:hypothetical protein
MRQVYMRFYAAGHSRRVMLWRDNLCEKSATIRMRVVVVAAGSGWPHGDQRSSGFAS